jgi:hypothetical protein
VTLNVNKLEYGFLSLKGTGSGSLMPINGKTMLVDGQLTLVNEGGVSFNLTTNSQGAFSGTMSVGTTQTATISNTSGVPTATFTDNTTATLF